MATQTKPTPKRDPLKARPRPDADAMNIATEVTERFSKSLEYLGR